MKILPKGKSRISTIYLIFGAVWILTTDQLAAMFPDSLNIQTYKGILFVVCSTALIYFIEWINNRESNLLKSRLQNRETLLDVALLETSSCLWSYARTTGRMSWSSQAYAIFDFEPFEVEPSLDELLARVSPEQRKAVRGHFEKIFNQQPDISDFEFDIILKTGDRRTLKNIHKNTYIEYPGDIMITGMIVDISKGRRIEKFIASGLALEKQYAFKAIEAIATFFEKRDPYTSGHQHRVSDLATAIATELQMDENSIEEIRIGALIHDIGKISIPSDILSRPGRLSPPEMDLIKTHPEVGYDIIKNIQSPWNIRDIVLQHHERLNGTGYPYGLTATEICMSARIVAIADVVEAITSHRPYRPALGREVALKEISEGKGTLYDAAAVDACLKLFGENRFSFTGEPDR